MVKSFLIQLTFDGGRFITGGVQKVKKTEKERKKARLGLWDDKISNSRLIVTFLYSIGWIFQAVSSNWSLITVNHFRGVSLPRCWRKRSQSPHSWHKCYPGRFIPHTNWKKIANVVNKPGGRWDGRTFGTNETPLENSKSPPNRVNRWSTITFVWLFVRVCLLFAKQPWKYGGCLGVTFSKAPSGGCYC